MLTPALTYVTCLWIILSVGVKTIINVKDYFGIYSDVQSYAELHLQNGIN